MEKCRFEKNATKTRINSQSLKKIVLQRPAGQVLFLASCWNNIAAVRSKRGDVVDADGWQLSRIGSVVALKLFSMRIED